MPPGLLTARCYDYIEFAQAGPGELLDLRPPVQRLRRFLLVILPVARSAFSSSMHNATN